MIVEIRDASNGWGFAEKGPRSSKGHKWCAEYGIMQMTVDGSEMDGWVDGQINARWTK